MKTIDKYPYKTVDELKKEFPNYWVLLMNAQYDKDFQITGGYLIAKGKNKIRVLEKSSKIAGKGLSFSIYYTGKIEVPENVILCF